MNDRYEGRRERPNNWRPGRKSSDVARRVAYNALLAVELDGAYANIALPREIAKFHLKRLDAGYATNLCYGTLRLQGRWDAIIAHCTDREVDPQVRILLRMGAHQLIEMRTPPHAAINETVHLARNTVGTGASGFVNAVLRRISERTPAQWQQQLRDDAGGKVASVKFLATWYSHPQWIVRAMAQALKANGRSVRDLVKVLRAHNEPAAVAVAARGISVADLGADIERGKMGWRPGELVENAVLLEGGDPGRIFAVKDGLAGVQDEGSQLVAEVFAKAPITGPDELWLDMCAGPGGKTASMVAANPQVRIHANELHAHRVDLVADTVRVWADRVALRQGDGRDLGDEEPETYDRVLLDAPCTGIGALRRRPEARWRKEAGDGLELSKLQLSLLESGWKALRPGGVIGYVTCSPYTMETIDVVETFLAGRDDAEVLDAPELARQHAKLPIVASGKYMQLWSDLDHSDAMFMAIIRKKEAGQKNGAGQ